MWSKVKDYIQKHKLLDANELYLVALSGGADSVTLLLLLDEMGFKIHAVHCNFHLRGDESDRDEQFCENLCQQKSIPFHRIHFDTLTYAETHKVSVEMAARELRYRYFEQLRKDIGADGVCVAHHRDDLVETVLLNMVRGTGLRGLCGIRPSNGKILRPLLCVSKQDILSYLDEKGQPYMTDSTNLEDEAQRNKVRMNILPLLQDINPAVSENIEKMAEFLAEAQKVLDAIVSQFKDNKYLYFSDLAKFNSREYLLFEWLKNYGFNGSQVGQILTAETGRVFCSSQGYDLLVDRDCYIVETSLKPLTPLRIPEEGTYVLDEDTRIIVRKEAVNVSKNPHVATLDAAKIVFPLTVRRVEEGDWMIPYGMEGRKLLSDLMTDRKMSLFEKRRQLVLVDGEGKVIWLVGVRTDSRCRVSGHTTEIVRIATLI